VDDHNAIVVDELALVRTGIGTILRQRGVEVLADMRSGREAVSLATIESPELVVCGTPADLTLVDTIRRLTRLRPRPALVALLPPAHDHEVSYLRALGVSGLALRSVEPEELGLAIDAVVKGGQYVASALHAALTGAVKLPPLDGAATDELLTSREREVLVLLAEGRTNRDIASTLSVTLATVKSHLVHIYAKLEATNRNEALGRAVALGLLA
jgi:DNA-binding NarL/FixJ family response regulator